MKLRLLGADRLVCMSTDWIVCISLLLSPEPAGKAVPVISQRGLANDHPDSALFATRATTRPPQTCCHHTCNPRQ